MSSSSPARSPRPGSPWPPSSCRPCCSARSPASLPTAGTAAGWLDAASYLISAALLLGTRPVVRAAGRRVLADFSFVRKNRTVRGLFATQTVFLFANAGLTTLLVPYGLTVLGGSARIGLVMSALGVGFLIGAPVLRLLVDRVRPSVLLSGALAVTAVGHALLFQASSVPTALPASALIGAAGSVALGTTQRPRCSASPRTRSSAGSAPPSSPAMRRPPWAGRSSAHPWRRPCARTTTFKPLIAVRPGYWRPANFASAAATLSHLTGGRVLINIVSGKDNLSAYGDSEGDQAERYARTREFMQLTRKLWTSSNVTFSGSHFTVRDSTLALRPATPPRLYFGGASAAAEQVATTEADVQLFWGEPLEGVRERIERLEELSAELGRELPPLQYGLRITTFVRDTTEQAWADAEAKVAEMSTSFRDPNRFTAVGQQRLLDLAARGEVLDDNLYTTPGRFGGGGAGTTWLVGSPTDVARSLRKYQTLGITHFVLSNTP